MKGQAVGRRSVERREARDRAADPQRVVGKHPVDHPLGVANGIGVVLFEVELDNVFSRVRIDLGAKNTDAGPGSAGRIVEAGGLHDIFEKPTHPYRKALLHAVPRFDMAPGERLQPIREIAAATGHLLKEKPEVHKLPTFNPYAPVLKVRHLSKTFKIRKADTFLESMLGGGTTRTIRAVNDVSFRVEKGEILGFLGPNGAGKTTTLLMVLGAITPDAGEVEICGVRQREHRSRAAEHIGFAAGYLPLAGEMRVHEYLTMYGRIYGIPDPQPAIAEGLERFHIEHLGEAMGSQLSSGQRTLVGIVRAFLHRPRLLVLDEPTASLDPDAGDKVRTQLTRYQRESGATLLLASHNMPEVERLCDKVLMMREGRIVDQGSPKALIAKYGRTTLEDVFLDVMGQDTSAAGVTP